MSKISFIIGIVAFGIFIMALFPCLGWMNWLNFPLAIAGAIMNGIVMGQGDALNAGDRKKALIGLGLCLVALVVGFIRLLLGGGVL